MYHYSADDLGTAHDLAEVLSGQSNASLCYDSDFYPFGGERTPLANSCTTAQHYKFTGKERDSESGNDYFGARYYASSVGRFLSPDPLGLAVVQARGKALMGHETNPQDWNMYSYALNNPVSLDDPTGLNACLPNDKSTTDCKVTVTVRDRTKDKHGNYNDQFKHIKNQQNFNATASVYTSYHGGKAVLRGIFLIKTTPSSGKYATIKAGTYSGTLIKHGGKYPAIMLTGQGMPTGTVPALGGLDPFTGKSYITDAEIHMSGLGNITGFTTSGMAISEGCSVIACSQYSSFESATGLTAPAPQRTFTILLEAGANGGGQ